MKLLEFFFPKKSEWQDVGIIDNDGYQELVQMQYDLKTKKKSFIIVRIGFISDQYQKREIAKNILTHYFK